MVSVTDDREVGNAPKYNEQLSVDEKLDADRLQAINEARKTAHKVRQNSRVGEFDGQWGESQSAAIFREALESYLVEVRQYKDVSKTAKQYWEGAEGYEIGTVVIDPPPGFPGEPVEVTTIGGLDDVLMAPSVFSETFERERTSRHGPDGVEIQTVHKTLDRDILKEALLWTNEYCRHIGLDLAIDAEDHKSENPGL